MKLNIILDENIENARQTFEYLGRTELVHGRKITPETVRDADILIVRSITNVNRELLEGSNVRFVGTATIGTDHVDTAYLAEKGIGFSSAKGCNSAAVAEYVFISIFRAAVRKGISLKGKSIGIVGCGNIGSQVERIAKAFGFETVVNDPPLQRETGDPKFRSLEDALKCDIISFHTPLNRTGADRTFHLLDAEGMKLLKNDAIVINASRGEVIDNAAFDFKLAESNITTILDVWEGEPVFSPSLLAKTFIASPHVAGYSLEGKINGTRIIHDALCDFLGLERQSPPALPKVENNVVEYRDTGSFEDTVERILCFDYDPDSDTANMHEAAKLPDRERGAAFDSLRKHYNLRREYSNYFIKGDIVDPVIKAGLQALRYNFSGG